MNERNHFKIPPDICSEYVELFQGQLPQFRQLPEVFYKFLAYFIRNFIFYYIGLALPLSSLRSCTWKCLIDSSHNCSRDFFRLPRISPGLVQEISQVFSPSIPNITYNINITVRMIYFHGFSSELFQILQILQTNSHEISDELPIFFFSRETRRFIPEHKQE